VALVAPQANRHRRHRLGDHELADLADDGNAIGVPRLDLRAERTGLQLAAVHRKRGDAADEGRAEIRAARRREEPDVRAELVVDPVEALGREW
jgi:hypothetical protein